MTTLTSILGLVPMSLGIGEGAEVQAPMARVVIGGMLTSTLITLLAIPTIYAIIEGAGRRRLGSQSLLARGDAGAVAAPLGTMGAD
jgi:HAE1 family hydrophobic/amphiphilic exporter-1